MKLYFLIFLTIFSSFHLLGQNETTWNSFWNEDMTLIGFKDAKGVVKIEPKFSSYTIANKFDDIIAISEENNGNWKSNYLTKSGKVFGKDSVYLVDNNLDCESEGFIRFKVDKTQKIGMFDRTGKVVIPAIYNELSQVRNGIIIGLKGAEKKYFNEQNTLDSNQFDWINGQDVLIDTLNNVLVENFEYESSLNFFSLEKTVSQHPDTTRKSFLAPDGSYFSFVDFEKEFKQWITKELMNNLTVERLAAISHDTISCESAYGWSKRSKQKLIKENFSMLKKGMLAILKANTDYYISLGALNQLMYQGIAFEKYYSNCGDSKYWMYPTMLLVISYNEKKEFVDNRYEFLKTENGYTLISLAMRVEELK